MIKDGVDPLFFELYEDEKEKYINGWVRCFIEKRYIQYAPPQKSWELLRALISITHYERLINQ